MNETDTISALTDIGTMVATWASLWVSLTFAFLTVSYFMGEALSRFQCLAISILYVTSAGLFGVGAIAYSQSWTLLRRRETTIFDDVWLMNNVDGWIGVMSFWVISGTLVSLYFMYNVRKTSGKRNSPCIFQFSCLSPPASRVILRQLLGDATAA